MEGARRHRHRGRRRRPAGPARGLRRNASPRPDWYASAEELLAQETLDFVDICTPPAAHAALVRAALERSLHVLCEKPLVLSPEELRGLPALAAEKERTLFTVHNWKHAPVLARVGELVRSGAIGEVRHCRWETLRDRPARTAGGEAGNWRVDPAQSGGGILVDHGWHALYVLQAWMPTTPRTVAARLSTRKHPEFPIEDTAELMLFHPSASAEIFLTWAADETRQPDRALGHAGQARARRRPSRASDVDGVADDRGVDVPVPDRGLAPPGLVRRRHRGVPRRDREPPRPRATTSPRPRSAPTSSPSRRSPIAAAASRMSAERAVGPGARR